MATVGLVVLVNFVLTAIAIYHITPLDIPVEVLKKIDSICHAYLGRELIKFLVGNAK